MMNLEQWDDATVVLASNLFGCLKEVTIMSCCTLAKLPSGLEGCHSLEYLIIDDCFSLMLNVQNMHNLYHLEICGLERLPEGLGELTRLKKLIIEGWMQNYEFSSFIHLASQLVELHLNDYGSPDHNATTQLPQQLQHLTNLQVLSISGFSHIEALPEWFGNLTSLKKLTCVSCVDLKELPSREAILRLTKLENLIFRRCPKLLVGEGDQEGAKLSHLPTNCVRRVSSIGVMIWVGLRGILGTIWIFRVMIMQHYCAASAFGLVGVESVTETELALKQIRETTSILDFQVEGREVEVLELLKLAIDSTDEHQMSVISIVGMGGLGKTTLAKMIFNHDAIKGHFDKTIRVCVSKPFIVTKILEKVFQGLPDTCSGLESNKEALLGRLRKEMQDEKYFLVLDDVWDNEKHLWDELSGCLKHIAGKSGSIIMVTTRNVEVATMVEPICIHHLNRLSDDQCWALFKESANANQLPMNSKLEIMKKEGGGGEEF
ncbi:hypothetical protein IC582_008969 [Cucumis melo]